MKHPALTASGALCALGTATLLTLLPSTGANAGSDRLDATLRDPAGRVVGSVSFSIDDDGTVVRAVLRPNAYVVPGIFHGFHVHANTDAANGSGCLADPAAPSGSWFVSVDGHYTRSGLAHGHHDGDLPSPLIGADGSAHVTFSTDRLDPDELRGRAVVLHAGPDNFGNVPTSGALDAYTPNSQAATDKTLRTGNAGDRVACGLID